jgi:hypothetical protein
MTDSAAMPDAATAPITEIMAARNTGAINSMVWSDTYAKVVENRLRADSGMPARAAPERINMQSIPTAADEGGHMIAANPGQVYRDGVALEQSLRAQVETENAAAGASKFDAITAAAYAPAKGPDDYTVPISHIADPQELAADSVVRQALHAAQLPTITANTITAAIDHAAMNLAHADGAQLRAFGDREGQGLRQLWGDQFAAKVQAVDAFLDSTADRVPFIAAVLANPRTRYFLADRRVVAALSQMIEGRAAGAPRR